MCCARIKAQSFQAAHTAGAIPVIAGTCWSEGLTVAQSPDGTLIYLAGTTNFQTTFDPSNAFAVSHFRPYIARYHVADLSLDQTFGVGGFAFLEDFQTSGGISIVRDWEGTNLLVASNGQIYLSFIYYEDISSTFYWAYGVARFNSDGTIDATFGTNGMYLTTPSSSLSYAPQAKVALQSNGGVIVSALYLESGEYSVEVRRLTSSGVLDTGFQGSGDAPGTWSSVVTGSTNWFGVGYIGGALAIDANDNVLVGYSNGTAGTTSMWVARINGATGITDSSFGTSGFTYLNFPQNKDAACRNLLMQGSNIIVVGEAAYNASDNVAIALARLNSSGALDASFGTSGMTVVASGFQVDDTLGTNCVFFDSLGNIVVFAWTMTATAQYYTPTRQGFCARYTANGAVDTSFGSSGFLLIPYFNGDTTDNEELYSGLLASDGSYIFCGHLFSSTEIYAQAYLSRVKNGAVISSTINQFAPVPAVATNAMSSIGTTTATVNAMINTGSNSIEWAFQYGEASGLYSAKTSAASAGAGGALTASLTGLTSGQTYYGRAAGWSPQGGLALGAEVTWTQM